MDRIKLSQIFITIGFTAVLSANVFAGSITGTVKFSGDLPKFKEIKMDADPVCLSFHKDPVFPQTLLLGEGNTMGNIFIQVKNPPAGGKAITEPVVIDQKGCNYHPHVAAVMIGQPLKILNPDGTLHNVHALAKVNQEFNMAMPKFRTEVTKSFDKAEGMFALKCDVHPWMAGWLTVVPHPYFAVTKEDGKFEIKDLPDGTYTVEAWHEKLGTKSGTAKVEGGVATVDFTFAAPQKK